MAPRKPRGIGYIRVSTAEQVAGNGLDVQEQAIREYAKRTGVRLVSVERDEGESGSNGLDTRPGVARALKRVEAGEADMLLVYRFDRLARDLVLQETIVRQLQRRKLDREARPAQVVSVTEPDVEGDDYTRDLVRQVLGAVAQYERAVIRSRMLNGKAAKRAKGEYVGGRPRFGYVAKDGALVPHKREQAAVALARKLRREGRSLRQIAEQLDDRGFAPKGGGSWQATQVSRLLAH